MKIKRKFVKKRTLKKTKIAKSPKSTGTLLGKTAGFPNILKFKHKYAQLINLTDSGSRQDYFFSCNGMYDPDISGTGKQPDFFDKLCAIYRHFTVIGSKIRYRVVPAYDTAQEPYKIVTTINDDTTVAGTIDAVAQSKYAKQRLCTGGINPSQIILTNSWSAKKFFSSPMANDELKGNQSANPVEQSYYQISFRTLDGVSTVKVWVQVEIEYIAVWRELQDQPDN